MLLSDYLKDPDLENIYRNPQKPFEKRGTLLFRENKLCIPIGNFRNKLIYDHHDTIYLRPDISDLRKLHDFDHIIIGKV